MLTEALLHYIWKFQLLDGHDLKTKSGLPIQVIHQGTYQSNAGADFANAKVKIGDIVLAGNIEIHVNENEWRMHNHHLDKAYNSVILHVVWQSGGDKTILENGEKTEVLELKNRVKSSILSRYSMLMQHEHEIACSGMKVNIDAFPLSLFLQKVGVERLQRKVNDINALLISFEGDWNQVIFVLLARYLGGSINNEPMQQLASSVSTKILYKSLSQPHIVEAILLGQGSLLNVDTNDEYEKKLYREYQYQKKLHHLTPLDKTVWKFARIRPKSFPNVRIAQLAKLVLSGNFQLERLLKLESVKEFSILLDKELGKQTIDSLVVNFWVPLLFAYGKYTGNEALCEKSIVILESVAAEKNSVVSRFDFLPKPQNAGETQALLELKMNYCDKLNCLNCTVGNMLLRK